MVSNGHIVMKLILKLQAAGHTVSLMADKDIKGFALWVHDVEGEDISYTRHDTLIGVKAQLERYSNAC